MKQHPLAETLERGRSRTYRGCHLGAQLKPGGSTPGERIDRLAQDPARLEPVLAAIGKNVGSNRRDVQTSLLVEAYAWTLLLPLAGALTAEWRVPRLGVDGVAVQLRDGMWPEEPIFRDGTFAALPSDGDARHLDAVIVEDGDALVEVLRAALIEHLSPALDALSAHSGRPQRALWRTITDRAAAAFLFAGQAITAPDTAARLAEMLLAEPGLLSGRPRYVVVDTPDGPLVAHARTGCCLWWRTGTGRRCLTCPLGGPAGPAPRCGTPR